MTWHYQIMKHNTDQEDYYAVHEYYDMADGQVWTENPVSITGNDVEELKKTLQYILDDIEKHGVKDYDV